MKIILKVFFMLSFVFFIRCSNRKENEIANKQFEAGAKDPDVEEAKAKVDEMKAENEANKQLLEEKSKDLAKKVQKIEKDQKEVKEKVEEHDEKFKEQGEKVAKHDEEIHKTKKEVKDAKNTANKAHDTAEEAHMNAEISKSETQELKEIHGRKMTKPRITTTKKTTIINPKKGTKTNKKVTTVEVSDAGMDMRSFKVGNMVLTPKFTFSPSEGTLAKDLANILSSWRKDTKFTVGSSKVFDGRVLHLSFDRTGKTDEEVKLHKIVFKGIDTGVLDKGEFNPECDLTIEENKIKFGKGTDINTALRGGSIRRDNDKTELTFRIYITSNEIKKAIENIHANEPGHSVHPIAKTIKGKLDERKHKEAAKDLEDSAELGTMIMQEIFVGKSISITINDITKTYKITDIRNDELVLEKE